MHSAMPRVARVAPGGGVYHVLNRTVARLPLFRKEADYAAFERLLGEAQTRHPTRILAWCLMRNHWHFVLAAAGRRVYRVSAPARPHTRNALAHGPRDGRLRPLVPGTVQELSSADGRALVDRLPLCGTQRPVGRSGAAGGGLAVGELVGATGGEPRATGAAERLARGSATELGRVVNAPMSAKEVESVRLSIARSRPLGSAGWQERMAARLGLMHTLRPEGRPKKMPAAGQHSAGRE